MNAATAARLLALNRYFYEEFGESFAATRQRLQPGVKRILETLRGDESILDLGCGNGELARALARRGHRGPYLGLDFSLPLLREAESPLDGLPAKFLEADITQLSVVGDQLSVVGGWTLITAFAVLHHVPSEELRLNLLQEVSDLLARNSRFILSNWQFLNSAKLRARIQPWSAAGLTEADVDAGDALLDWRDGGKGLRYVHHFSAQELSDLAGQIGLRVSESFLSDGEGGKLGLYQVWEKS
ncbi:MAG TPA: class I SAM-dependent methyltransferase [Anaerolineales bacterium]